MYISPLKALNNDIERNLRVPLEGIRATAERLDIELPALRVAVRTGDTPSSARAAMLKHPPHILITTPESLYLMLTSPRAREMFRTTRTVIVDEIHTLVGNKRGAHLALSLERLCHLATERVQRIGLSATIKPLEEAARFLGGQTTDDGRPTTEENYRPPSSVFRPVTIVNAGYKKSLDLKVVTVVDDFKQLVGETIWPLVVPRVLSDIMAHRTTLIFANNRRLAERTADRLNAQFTAVQSEEIAPDSTEALAPHGLPRDRGMFAIGAEGPFRAHHGSMSKEARRKMEQDLKDGKLPALVGTSSLELGIDIGAVDLVVQLQSPKSVAQGLQRVGRSGHLVGQTSVGRIYATFREDLVEAAAIVRGMLEGDVEETRAPENPLDVLAQQIVAMVACETWSVPALYDLVRRAYP
ncbi:MAG: DEAD/DEAH box helicase, partial [Anaerolineales bacterium]|nr:DEAD/DEAH box helicase [Anaerolineales bacterium]